MHSTNLFPDPFVAKANQCRTAILLIIASIEILALCLSPKWILISGLSVIGLISVFGVFVSVLCGRGDFPLLGWILIFPLGYYYLSYPEVHPVITLDRVFIGILLVTACLAPSSEVTQIPVSVRKSAACWAVFLFFAAITIPRTKVPLNSLRALLDGFLFPGLLAWFILRYFDVRRHLSRLHVLACIMVIYVGAIGAAEVVLQRDLLSMPDSSVFLAGDYKDSSSQILLRPNGPFSTTNSFALIGLVSLFFLPFLKNAGGRIPPRWRRLLHGAAMASALLTAIMPLFRSVFLSLLIILLAGTYYSVGKRRMLRMAAVSGLLLIGLAVRTALPDVFEERSDPGNIFGRLAEDRQIWAMFSDSPLNGVGLNNFYYAASPKAKYIAYYGETQSVDYPHNNLGGILAETGLTGFVPFVLSQVFLVLAFWRVRRSGIPDSTLIWKTFLFIFLAYWINGMSLASGYYSDLNLWYLCALAMMLKYAFTAVATSTELPTTA